MSAMSATASSEPPPPPPPVAGPPPSRWWRSQDDRYLGGVAGGLGERWAVDPLFVRLGLVAATLVTGSGGGGTLLLAGYALAWSALPVPGGRPIVRRLDGDDGRREAAAVAVAFVAAAVLLPRLGPGGSTSLRVGVVLAGLAVALLADRRDGDDVDGPPDRASDAAPPVRPSSATAPVEEGPTQPVAGTTTGSSAATGRLRSERWPLRPTARGWSTGRRRSTPAGPALWPLTIALLVIWAIAFVAVDRLVRPGLPPGIAVSGGLAVVGGVLLVSAWRGRARGTVLIGLALLPAWIGLATSGIPRFEGAGDRFLRPASAEEAAGRHELGYGRLVVDLRDVDLEPGEVLRTGVAVTAGMARVVVPADTNLVVMGPVGLGAVRSNPHRRSEWRELLAVDRTLDWAYGPQARRCEEQLVPVTGLSFSDGTFASVDELAAELRRRGWAAPRPSPSAADVLTEPELMDLTEPELIDVPAAEAVLVAVDDAYRLCDASLTSVPEDPATIVLRVELGLANLEVSRAQPD